MNLNEAIEGKLAPADKDLESIRNFVYQNKEHISSIFRDIMNKEHIFYATWKPTSEEVSEREFKNALKRFIKTFNGERFVRALIDAKAPEVTTKKLKYSFFRS